MEQTVEVEIPIPTAQRAVPLLGHILRLARDPLVFLKSLPQQGDLVRVRLGPFTAVVVCDPDLTWQVLLDDRVFDKGGLFFDRVAEVGGDGLLTSPRSRHRRQRRLMQPAFHQYRLPSYAQIMTEQIAAVTNSWRDGQSLDVLEEMSTITTRILAATMFSNALSPETVRQVCEDFSTAVTGLYRRMLTPPPLDRLPTPGRRRYYQARARLLNTVQGVIADRRVSGADHGDLLSALLAARDPDSDGDGLTDSELVDQVVTVFGAGVETNASALAWALHLLAQHRDVNDRLQAEVDTVLAGRAAVYADLPKLELTRRIITETLRVWPPAWILTRVTTVDTHLGDHLVPAGTNVVYSAYLIHHRPDVYTDADRFDPDRWLPERAKAIPRDAFIPFGFGARKCIGDAFGLTEATLALATIVTRYDLEPVPGQHVRPAPGGTLRPHGLRMRVTARTSDRQHLS
jgi:pentalenene oxygenase